MKFSASIISRPLEDGEMSTSSCSRTSIAMPVASNLSRPLEDGEVPTSSCSPTSIAVPAACASPQLLQCIKLPILGSFNTKVFAVSDPAIVHRFAPYARVSTLKCWSVHSITPKRPYLATLYQKVAIFWVSSDPASLKYFSVHCMDEVQLSAVVFFSSATSVRSTVLNLLQERPVNLLKWLTSRKHKDIPSVSFHLEDEGSCGW